MSGSKCDTYKKYLSETKIFFLSAQFPWHCSQQQIAMFFNKRSEIKTVWSIIKKSAAPSGKQKNNYPRSNICECGKKVKLPFNPSKPVTVYGQVITNLSLLTTVLQSSSPSPHLPPHLTSCWLPQTTQESNKERSQASIRKKL